MRIVATLLVAALVCGLAAPLPATESTLPARPAIWGVARTLCGVSELAVARDFYGAYLGMEEAFTYDSSDGKVTVFKVSDRQFIEVMVQPDARQLRRLLRFAFEVEDVEAMRRYLAAKGVTVPAQVANDGAGNESLVINGPDGHSVEFVRWAADGLHRRSAGKALSPRRVSQRLHHVGFSVSDEAAANRFYRDILGCEEYWRANPGDARPNFVYLRLPDCVENIEYMLINGAPTSHPCFAVPDMQTALYALKERHAAFPLGKPSIGKGRRWLLQLANADGTPAEFTEPFTLR